MEYLTGQNIMFVLLSALVLVCGFLSVTSTKILRAATYLFFTLFGVAGLYLLMSYEFLAAVQLSVYAGGIVVLLIFAILLVKNIGEETEQISCTRKAICGIAALAGVAITIMTLYYGSSAFMVNESADEMVKMVDMTMVGEVLMGTDQHQYLLVFESASVLLLACIVGAIVVATKSKEED